MEHDVFNPRLSGCVDLINEAYRNYKYGSDCVSNLGRIRSLCRSLADRLDRHMHLIEEEKSIKERDFEEWILLYHSNFETFWERHQDEVVERAKELGWECTSGGPEQRINDIRIYVQNIFAKKREFYELWDRIELDIREGNLIFGGCTADN